MGVCCCVVYIYTWLYVSVCEIHGVWVRYTVTNIIHTPLPAKYLLRDVARVNKASYHIIAQSEEGYNSMWLHSFASQWKLNPSQMYACVLSVCVLGEIVFYAVVCVWVCDSLKHRSRYIIELEIYCTPAIDTKISIIKLFLPINVSSSLNF